MYGLLTKCEVKMAGYWPSSFFACLWTETKSRSITSQKKNEANMYGLLTKCEVKMAGYWPSSLSACLWTETKSRSINSQKKENEANIHHLNQTNLVNKGFIIWLLVKFCLRDTAGSPKRARCLHLARSGSQSQRAI